MAQSAGSGLEGVVVADTALSEVDGERGRLVIAGHDVERLAGALSFEELCRELWAAVPGATSASELREALGRERAVGLRAARGPRARAPCHGRDGRAPGRAGPAPGGGVRLGPRCPADGGVRGVHRGMVEAAGGARAAPARPRGRTCRGSGADAAGQGHRTPGHGARDLPGHRQRPRDERLDVHRPGHRLDRLGRGLGGGGGARCAQGTSAWRGARPGAGHAGRHRTAGGGGGLARARAARGPAHHGDGPSHLPDPRPAGRGAGARRGAAGAGGPPHPPAGARPGGGARRRGRPAQASPGPGAPGQRGVLHRGAPRRG